MKNTNSRHLANDQDKCKCKDRDKPQQPEIKCQNINEIKTVNIVQWKHVNRQHCENFK